MNFDDFLADRHEALMSFNLETVNAYLKKYGTPPMPDTIEAWAGIHKARVIITTFPEHEKEVSRQWLRAHDFKVPEET